MDFLILFEHQSRELESICLLKRELEIRGYTAKISYVHNFLNRYYRPKVVIVPYLYDDGNIKDFLSFKYYKTDKIINLQWEQVLSKAGEKRGNSNPRGEAKKGFHITWGEETKKRLIEAGVKEKNICVTGNISMDFCYEKFSRLYTSKENIGKEYKIPVNYNWYLFISSFTLTDDYVYKAVEDTIGENNSSRYMKGMMIRSQIEILNWFREILEKDTNIYIIYRPHPAEFINKDLQNFIESCDRFKCIADLSVRQWINVSDEIFTWYSTSIVDAFYMKRRCNILRPFKIRDEDEVMVMRNARFITSVDELLKINEKRQMSFPIKYESISKYYGKWTDGLAYKRIADVCVKVLRMKKSDIIHIPYYNANTLKYNLFLIMESICSFIKISTFFR